MGEFVRLYATLGYGIAYGLVSSLEREDIEEEDAEANFPAEQS